MKNGRQGRHRRNLFLRRAAAHGRDAISASQTLHVEHFLSSTTVSCRAGTTSLVSKITPSACPMKVRRFAAGPRPRRRELFFKDERAIVTCDDTLDEKACGIRGDCPCPYKPVVVVRANTMCVFDCSRGAESRKSDRSDSRDTGRRLWRRFARCDARWRSNPGRGRCFALYFLPGQCRDACLFVFLNLLFV